MQDEEGKKEMMTATHEGKTYVASVSLEDQIGALRADLLITRHALRFTRWVVWGAVGLGASAFLFLAWLKFDTIVTIARRLLG